jgi:hypothetical protein
MSTNIANFQNLLARPLVGKLGFNGILAIGGILGPLIFIAAEFITIATTENYSIITNSISSLAYSKLGWVQTIGFLAWGLLVEIFTAGIFFTIKGGRFFGFSLAILVLFGFSLLMVGAFHSDVSPDVKTIEGSIHIYSAKLIFWLFPAAAVLIVPSLKKEKFFNPLVKFSIITAVLALVLMLCIVIFAEKQGWFGLFERLLVADTIIWVIVMAVWMLRYSCDRCGRPAD